MNHEMMHVSVVYDELRDTHYELLSCENCLHYVRFYYNQETKEEALRKLPTECLGAEARKKIAEFSKGRINCPLCEKEILFKDAFFRNNLEEVMCKDCFYRTQTI